MLKAALWYAARGWAVFPLAPRQKVPLISKEQGGHGALDATCDEGQIHAWWGKNPQANIGLTLLYRLVVDIDPRHGGDETWTALCLRYGGPETLTQQTGSIGLHYVFRHPGFDPKGRPGAGIDCKHGPNQYIVAAPSIQPNGNKYTWINRAPTAEVPSWLADLLRRDEPIRRPLSAYADRRDKSRAFQSAARYLDKCPIAISGQRGHDVTFAVVSKVVRNFTELDEGELWILLDEWNNRCAPPWSKRELMHKISDSLRVNRGGVAA